MNNSKLQPLFNDRTLFHTFSPYKMQILPKIQISQNTIQQQPIEHTLQTYHRPNRNVSYNHQISKVSGQGEVVNNQQLHDHSVLMPLFNDRTLYHTVSTYKRQIVPQIMVSQTNLRKQSIEPTFQYQYSPDRILSYVHQMSKINGQWEKDIEVNQQSLIQRIMYMYGQYMDQRFQALKPQSDWLLIWNVINVFAIQIIFLESLFLIFIISLIADQRPDLLIVDKTFCYIMGLIFVIDMVVIRPRVAYYQNGKTVCFHKQTLQNYINTYFTFDFVSAAVLLINVYDFGLLFYIRIILYLKLFSMRNIMQQIFLKAVGIPVYYFLYKFFKLIFFVLFCSFLNGSIFVSLDLHLVLDGGYYYQNGLLWITSSPQLKYLNLYDNFQWYIWFQYGLFMTMQMIRGCGYGTPTPISPLSQLFFNTTGITMTGLFVFYVHKMIEMIAQLMQEEKSIEKQYSNFGKFKQQYNMISVASLRYHYFRKLSYERQQLQDYRSLRFNMSNKLSNLLNYTCRSYYILQLQNFSDIFQGNQDKYIFRIKFARIIKSSRFYEGRRIFKSNQHSIDRLYFSGLDQISISRQQIGYRENLPSWSVIGARQFFIDKRSHFDVVSKKAGIVQYIKHWQFLPIIKEFRNIYQRYFQIIDSIKLGQINTEKIGIICCFCSQYHLYEYCQLYYPWKRQAALFNEKKYEEQFAHQRVRYYRQKYQPKKVVNLTKGTIQVDSYFKSQIFYALYNF